MSKKRSLLSLLLCFAILFASVPFFAVPADRAPALESAALPPRAVIEKSVSDGVLTVEAYLTGTSIAPTDRIDEASDIVLVLDQSGSMSQKFEGKTTKQQAMKQAVCSFVDAVAAKYNAGTSHRISVVTFSGKAQTLADWTEADEQGAAALKSKVNGMATKLLGATNMDLGLKQARTLLTSRGETDRKQLVVLFTDGYPGDLDAIGDYFSSGYDTPDEADDAVKEASELKKLGATVCTVGIFEDANPAASYVTTKKTILWTVWRSAAKSANGLMHFISSDYDETCTSWRKNTTSNDGRNNGYYSAASDPAALIRTFEAIADEYVAGIGEVTVGSDAVLCEELTDDFALNGEITTSVAPFDSLTGTFGDETVIRATVSAEGRSIKVSGFDFSAHACAEGSKNGQKLIVRIPVKDVTKDYGLLPVTTAASGLYDAEGYVIAYSEPASFTLLDTFDLSANYTNTAAIEKYFKKVFGTSDAFEKLWPTMSSLHKVGDNLYLLDYQFDYDIEDLMKEGASSAVDLLGYASKYILGNTFSFRLGSFDFGCSAFEAYNEKGDHFMGRNFDYMDAPSYVVWTHPKNGYASVSMVDGTFLLTTDRLLTPESTLGRFQTLLAPYLPLDGINEKGLSVCVLQIHDDATRQDNGKTDMFTTAMIRIILDKAKDVNEAIALFDSFDLSDTVLGSLSLGACFHYLVSDASGDAAIIEYVNGEMRVIRAEDPALRHLCVTNFYVSEDGGVGSDKYDPEGMERYDMIASALTEGHNMLTFDQTFRLLSDVHLNYRHDNGLYDITTLWSGLYNNTQKTLSIAPRMNYDEIYTFDVLRPMRVTGTASVEVTMPKEGIGLR